MFKNVSLFFKHCKLPLTLSYVMHNFVVQPTKTELHLDFGDKFIKVLSFNQESSSSPSLPEGINKT